MSIALVVLSSIVIISTLLFNALLIFIIIKAAANFQEENPQIIGEPHMIVVDQNNKSYLVEDILEGVSILYRVMWTAEPGNRTLYDFTYFEEKHKMVGIQAVRQASRPKEFVTEVMEEIGLVPDETIYLVKDVAADGTVSEDAYWFWPSLDEYLNYIEGEFYNETN